MALKATIFKAELQLSDIDRSHFRDYALTIARHPSESDERMMARVVAFARHASERLEFTKGLCADDEPELWSKDLTGAIELWIDLGQPEERRVRRACGRAREVVIYGYHGRAFDIWWEQNQAALAGLENLRVYSLPAEAVKALAGLVRRTMRLQCTLQEGQLWLSDEEQTVLVEPEVRK